MKHVRSPPTTMKTMKTMKTATTLWRRGWIFDSSSCCLLAGRLRRLRRHLHLLRRASNHSSELSKYGARKKSPFRQRTAKCPHSDASLPPSLRLSFFGLPFPGIRAESWNLRRRVARGAQRRPGWVRFILPR